MCGIAGAVGFITEEVAQGVRAMDAAQEHRGPDGHGCWSSLGAEPHHCGEYGVLLAHRRLAIIDLSAAGAQPMVDPASGAVIVFNGEVYNFRQIRRELEAKGEHFVSGSDTEVVLRSIITWGVDAAVRRFRGMFALAVWDPRSQQVYLVRDRVGIKPLYLAEIGQGARRTLLFASELRAILQSGLVDRRIDPNGLSTYLWNGFVYGPDTIVRGTSLLPSGSTMTITPQKVSAKPKSFWQFPSAPLQYRKDAVDELRHELEEAVHLRLISDVPLGIFLSGGIDSSAVAALAAKSTSADLVRTFTIGFTEGEYDESPYAEAVAKALGTRHTCLRLTEGMFSDHLNDALASIDQPTFDGINTYFVSRAVRQAGITVALAGTGGDELFGGYRSFIDLPNAHKWSGTLRFVPANILRTIGYIAELIQRRGKGNLASQARWGKLGDALTCRGSLVRLYQIAYGMFTTKFYNELTQDLQCPSKNFELINGICSVNYYDLDLLVKGQPTLNAIANLELASFICQRLMRDTDAASMAVSLEARVPLLDHRVIECATAVAPEQRFHPLGDKRLLRQLTLGRIDPKLFNRPKTGFVLPIDRWCRNSLRDQVQQTLNDKKLCCSVGVHPPSVAALAQAFQAGQPGIYWTRLWMMFVLLHWCKTYRVSI